jgi:predicted anti-sigma-YlaC factor YlaD
MRRWSALRLILFLTCRDAAPLISHAMDRRLEKPEHAALRVHLAICPNCRRYRRQLMLLRRALMLLAGMQPPPPADALPPEARSRIRQAVRQAR